MNSEIIGYIATVLSVIKLIPQVIQTIKTKTTRDISLGMCSLFLLGQALWFVYGMMINSRPIIIANACTFVFVGIIFLYKLRYK